MSGHSPAGLQEVREAQESSLQPRGGGCSQSGKGYKKFKNVEFSTLTGGGGAKNLSIFHTFFFDFFSFQMV